MRKTYSFLRSSELQHSETATYSAHSSPISHSTLQPAVEYKCRIPTACYWPCLLGPCLLLPSHCLPHPPHLPPSTVITLAYFPFLYLERLFSPEAFALAVFLPEFLSTQNLQCLLLLSMGILAHMPCLQGELP